MKKIYFLIILIIVLILGFIFILLKVNEDNWIKDSRGVWIKHGNPSITPEKVLEQERIINCSLEKFNSFTDDLNSQCLGICEDYAVDIVHVPRTKEDNLVENQCADFREGKVSHFIELNKNGEVVRIV